MKLHVSFPKIIFICILLLTSGKISIAQNNLRPIDQLTADSSGFDIVRNAMRIARNKYEILPADLAKAKDALYQTQVTTRSPMGAIIYFTGGILIDGGWIRILGSGNDKLDRSLAQWNKGKTFNELGEKPKFLLIADDVVGGFFATNGGAFGSDLGMVYYLAPDDLRWEAQHMSYTDFINFCFVGDMNQYYSGLRWEKWQKDMKEITGNKGFFTYPYLWTKEGKDIETDTRKVVPIQELYDFETTTLSQIKK